MTAKLTLAIAKGRILKQCLPLLARAAVVPLDDLETSRKLVFPTSDPCLELMIIRAVDVPTFVRHGAADLGVTGKDVLLEHGYDGLYEPLDLGIGRCRMMVAGDPNAPRTRRRLKVATKYVNTARRHFAAAGVQADIIKLSGAMELAPLCGLADQIVDLVETGTTLKANGLEPLEHIVDISSRLIVNQASMKTQHAAVTDFVARLSLACNETSAAA
jgi:ATP phosphoribosyltransferase